MEHALKIRVFNIDLAEVLVHWLIVMSWKVLVRYQINRMPVIYVTIYTVFLHTNGFNQKHFYGILYHSYIE